MSHGHCSFPRECQLLLLLSLFSYVGKTRTTRRSPITFANPPRFALCFLCARFDHARFLALAHLPCKGFPSRKKNPHLATSHFSLVLTRHVVNTLKNHVYNLVVYRSFAQLWRYRLTRSPPTPSSHFLVGRNLWFFFSDDAFFRPIIQEKKKHLIKRLFIRTHEQTL